MPEAIPDANAGRRPAVVIAVGNLKGGTGKSTIAVNVACALAAMGHATVVIDADPQHTATQWMRRRALPARLHETPPLRDLEAAAAWMDDIHDIGAAQDFVVIDLPAVLGATLGAALLVADLVLIPAATSSLDLAATTRTLHRIAKAEDERSGTAIPSLVVPNRVESGWFRDGGLRRMRMRVPVAMAPPIRRSPLFAEAFDAADWIGGYAPRSRAHRDILRLARAILARLTVAAPAKARSTAAPSIMTAAGLAAC
jgi:chromosome partitioning protein